MDTKENTNSKSEEEKPFSINNMTIYNTTSADYPVVCQCDLCHTLCLSIKAAFEHPIRCAAKLAEKKKKSASKSNTKNVCECCNVVYTRKAALKRHQLEVINAFAIANKDNLDKVRIEQIQMGNDKQKIATSTMDNVNNLSEGQPSTSKMSNEYQLPYCESSTSKAFNYSE